MNQENSIASPGSFSLQAGQQPEFEAEKPADEELSTGGTDLLLSPFAYALTKVGLRIDKSAM